MPVQSPEVATDFTRSVSQRGAFFRTKRQRIVSIVVLCVAVLLLVAAAVLASDWPFTRAAVTRSLEEDSQAQVQIGSFRETYFPHPGGIAENVTFARDATSPRLTVRRLSFIGSYVGLLHHYVPRIVAEGAVLAIPAGALKEIFASRSNQPPTETSVGEIDLDGGQLSIADPESDQPLLFNFHRLRLTSLASHSAIHFSAAVTIPEPQGELQIQGRIGPMARGEGNNIPIAGSYSLKNADLGQFAGIGGSLASDGKFEGTLHAINMDGDVAIPDFELDTAGHPTRLTSKFHAIVNGANGDVELNPVQSQWGKTTVISRGTIHGENGNQRGKTVNMDMVCPSGSVQDLLWLFVHDDRPSMTGKISLHAKALLPPGKQAFLDRLKMRGEFGIVGGHYPSPKTQKDVDVLSARARGEADRIEDAQDKDKKNGTDTVDQMLEDVVSNVQGDVTLTKGIAEFSKLSFDVPGASALLDGNYNLRNKKIDMHGTVRLDSKLSKTTTGVKSFLLKVVQPFAKRKGEKGSTVSVHVTGTYGHPEFAVSPFAGGQ